MFPLQWFWQSPWKDLPQMRRKWGVFAHDLASQKRRSVSGVISSESLCGKIRRSVHREGQGEGCAMELGI